MDINEEQILLSVSEARKFGKIGNYDTCLQKYALAKEIIEQILKSCRVGGEYQIWNSLIKEIVAEESSIRRLKSTMDDIVKQIKYETGTKPQTQQSTRPESSCPKLEFIATPKLIQLDQPMKRANIRKVSPTKRVSNPVRSKPFDKENNDKKKNVVFDDPFKKQIADMGILIREPNVQWEMIAGLASVKRLLRQNLVILPMRPDICRGLLSPWRSVLFYGPPGTGKTFLAKAIATECKRTFFNVTSATVTSRFHGESEKLVSTLFSLAEDLSPSTIFFDEIDSLASKRGAQNEQEASRKMKAMMLTKLEGICGLSDSNSVFVLAATNFPWDLDEALLRRFQKRIYIPLPDQEGRKVLLHMNMKNLASNDFDFDEWANILNGYSGADIANLCKDAAQMVIDRQMELIGTDEWLKIPREKANIIISNDDFATCVRNRKSSVDLSSIRLYEEWRQAKGAE